MLEVIARGEDKGDREIKYRPDARDTIGMNDTNVSFRPPAPAARRSFAVSKMRVIRKPLRTKKSWTSMLPRPREGPQLVQW